MNTLTQYMYSMLLLPVNIHNRGVELYKYLYDKFHTPFQVYEGSHPMYGLVPL